MPRRNRCLLPGVACHITQRGVDRRETFSSGEDRHTYLGLLRQNFSEAGVHILGYCLMTNHVHLVAVPERQDSLSILMRRVAGRYAQYYNARSERIGHLWQNRFFSCVLAPDRVWTALAYVERNPLRARLVRRCEDYLWSSAVAHITGGDGSNLLDMEWWRKNARGNWRDLLNRPLPKPVDRVTAESAPDRRLRECTYAGRPFGDECFVDEMSMRFQRHWTSGKGRPSKKSLLRPHEKAAQFPLFRLPDP